MNSEQPWKRARKRDNNRRIRLGDAVAAIAQPVARAIDRIAGTDLAHCRSCADRKARWNGDPGA